MPYVCSIPLSAPSYGLASWRRTTSPRPGHPPCRLRHPQARRYRRPVRDRSARDPGPAARRAGDPAARAGYLPVARAAAQEQGARPRDAAQRASVDRPTLIMVTFFGLLPQARFSPEDVNVTSRGRLSVRSGSCRCRRGGTRTSWTRRAGGRPLPLRRGHQFSRGHDGQLPGPASNDAWTGVLPTLDRERARVDGPGEPAAEAVGGSHALFSLLPP